MFFSFSTFLPYASDYNFIHYLIDITKAVFGNLISVVSHEVGQALLAEYLVL